MCSGNKKAKQNAEPSKAVCMTTNIFFYNGVPKINNNFLEGILPVMQEKCIFLYYHLYNKQKELGEEDIFPKMAVLFHLFYMHQSISSA